MSVDGRSDLRWLIALSTLPGLGSSSLRATIIDGDAAGTWSAIRSGVLPRHLKAPADRLTAWSEAAQNRDVDAIHDRHRSAGVCITVWGDPDHPGDDTVDPFIPPVLFWSRPPVGSSLEQTVAIVGTRKATRYGSEVAREFGAALASVGVSVVSGLARGIDAHGHLGALERVEHRGSDAASGPRRMPVGVVACGLDVVYPRANAALHARVREAGVLVSEYPLGTSPAAWRFPARNRIIVGLSKAVIVVESHDGGGSLITAGYAAQRGIELLAVPGSIRSPASSGTNKLISDGAIPALGLPDVIVALGLTPVPDNSPTRHRVEAGLGPVASEILEDIGWEQTTFDDVVERSAHGVGAISHAVAELRSAGLLTAAGGVLERAPRGADA